jgi:hypothetical protein
MSRRDGEVVPGSQLINPLIWAIGGALFKGRRCAKKETLLKLLLAARLLQAAVLPRKGMTLNLS